MTIKELHNNVDCSKEIDIDYLKEFIKIPSLSNNRQGVLKCVNFLTDLLAHCGFFTQVFKTSGNPLIYGEIIVDRTRPTLLFYGHYDVQPTGALNLWNTPPFIPTEKDGRLYGRGAGDGKSQLLANILAVSHYIDTFGQLPINIKFIIEGEEETGSSSLEKFSKQNKDLLASDLVYITDGSMALDDTPIIALGSRGVMRLSLELTTAYADNHSGSAGGAIENAAWGLVKVLASMMDDQGQVLIKGFYDQMVENDQDLQALKSLPFDRSRLAEVFDLKSIEKDQLKFFQDLTLRPSLTINKIDSGYACCTIDNKVPGRAGAELEIRLAYNQKPYQLKELVKSHIHGINPYIKIKSIDNDVPPSRSIIDLERLEYIRDSVGKVRDKKPIIVPSWGGSLPSFIWSEILEIPSVLVPYANIDENNYGPNENIRLDLFEQAIKTTAQIIHDFQEIIGEKNEAD